MHQILPDTRRLRERDLMPCRKTLIRLGLHAQHALRQQKRLIYINPNQGIGLIRAVPLGTVKLAKVLTCGWRSFTSSTTRKCAVSDCAVSSITP